LKDLREALSKHVFGAGKHDRCPLEDRHTRAESRVHLSEFEAERPAANYHE
jgi:hypothetical protein